MSKDEDTISEGKEKFELSAERESMNRGDALDDLRFARLDEHWPADIQKQREGRPCLTIPKLQPFIRQVVNDARQNKPAIKVHPSDSKADPKTAEIFDGLIKNIEQTSKADVAYDIALESAASMGWGYFRIQTEYACDDSFDLDLLIKQVPNPFSIYGDPYSTLSDSSDWNTAFVTELLSQAEFKRRYKGAKEVDWDSGDYSELKSPWAEGKEVLIAEWWEREKVEKTILMLSDGQVIESKLYEKVRGELDQLGITVMGERPIQSHKITQRLMTGAEVLKTNEWAGKYIPLVPVYGETVNVEGKRYLRSLIRGAKDAQRMFNYWRTFTTELVALAPKIPFIGAVGQFQTDQSKWETANTDSHAYIEYDMKGSAPAPVRQPFAGVPAGALQEALNSSDDMKAIIGVYDAGLGARSNEVSGKAIMARQREGDVSTFHFIDNLARAIEHGGRILIDLIPKVYTGERMIRILGGEENEKVENVQLGRPVEVMGPDGQQQMDPQTQLPMTRIYDLSAGKYDLTVTTGPSFTSRREEAATQMMELLRAFPAAAPVIGDLLAKNLDWPGADEIAKRLEMLQQSMLQGGGQAQPAPPPPPDPAAMAKVQLDAQTAQQEIQLKTMQLQVDAYRAETERMKAQNDAATQRQSALAGNVPQRAN